MIYAALHPAFRNRLYYPAGATPGVDPNHPASKGLLCSAICVNGGSISLSLPTTCTAINGPPFVIDSVIGPSTQPATTNNAGTKLITQALPDAGIVPQTQFTLGVIFRALAINGGTNAQITNIGNTGVSFAQYSLIMTNSTGALTMTIANGGGTVTTNLSIAANIPYFYGASTVGGTGNPANGILVNLLNGGYQTFSTTANASFSATGINLITIGNSTGQNRAFGGNVACAMYSTAYLSPAQFRAWAADPWAFWYPRVIPRETLIVGAAQAAAFRAWYALNKQQVAQGLSF